MRPIPTHPHLSHSVAVYGKVDHGRPRQSQVQPCTVRYSAEKTHLVFWGHLVTTWGPLEGIIWDMSGASSGECLEHVWGIIDVRNVLREKNGIMWEKFPNCQLSNVNNR